MSWHTWSPTGPPSVRSVSADCPEDLIAHAEKEEQRAADALRRAGELREEAARWAADQAERTAAAREQRRARAAATRAHNADPFGLRRS